MKLINFFKWASCASVALGFTFASTFTFASMPVACEGTTPVERLALAVKPAKIVRGKVPPSIFGFHVPWFDFQLGHFRSARVRPETIEWMRPFEGAAYRYPGGNSFEWEKATSPFGERRKIFADFEGMAYPEFGPREFFRFVQSVEGKAIVLLNIAGKRNELSSVEDMVKSNMAYLDWLSTINGPGCVGGDDCPLLYFELGNEVEWDKALKWSADQYVSRISPLITQARQRYPEIKFAVVGKTAPWDGILDVSQKDFDGEVARQIAKQVDAVTFHPYYDGLSIPEVRSYMFKTLLKYRKHNPRVNVLVTEHGRWPTIPKVGRWEDNWYQASGSGGAISAADFTLMAIGQPEIAGAMWHALAVKGPWQLFHWNKKDDTLYPSATYWALRVLREGLLEDAIEVTPSLIKGSAYHGGYNMRLAAMKNNYGSISVLGVNREHSSKMIDLNLHETSFTDATATIRVLQADTRGSDNTAASPNQFEMKTVVSSYSSAAATSFCIPPNSTFSIKIEKDSGKQVRP